jgi:glycosyltransferase involved in cell wall biosynthesis
VELALIQSFLPSRSQGGVGHFADQLANQLVQRGHRVTVFSLDPPPPGAGYQVESPSDAARWPRSRWGRVYGFAFWVAKQNFSRFDLVHAMGDNHLLGGTRPVLRTLSGSALAEARSGRSLPTKLLQLTLYPLELIGAARATLSVGISHATLAHFPGVRRVVPNAVDLDTFSPGGSKSRQPSVLGVGHRLRDRKRLDLLVDSFSKDVKRRLPSAQLWLVCDETVDLPGVRCFRDLTTVELSGLYRRAWLFCLPSAFEGFGRPYVEALASGTPVVATPNPGAREILEDGRFGVLVKEAELGPALVGLLQAPNRRAEIARAGVERAREFSWASVTAEYERLYAGLLQSQLPAVREVRDAG